MEKCLYNQGQVGIIHPWLWMWKVYSYTLMIVFLSRRNSLPFCKTISEAFEDTDPAKCAKVVNYLMTSKSTDCIALMDKMVSLSPVCQQKQTAELDLSAEVATRLNLVDRETSAFVPPEAHSAHTVHTRYSDEDIPRLTKVRLAVRRHQMVHG